MIIKTERLILRPWKEDDAESLYKYAKDPKVGPIAGWPVHRDVENSREIIKGVLSADETYAVCLKEDNAAIGSIGLIPPAQSHTAAGDNELEVGYWIGVPFWGNGYIPEAVRALQRHAFEDLGLSAMWCGYYDGNEKSKRCQEKCGFVYHHTEVNKPCPLMGDIRTEHFTYLTKEQWQNNNQDRIRDNTQNNIQDKIRGSLFAGAIGDALGYTVEFWGEGEIFGTFGPEGITEYRLKNGKAIISDDTQMTLFTAAGLLNGEELARHSKEEVKLQEMVALAYQDWLLTQERSYKTAQKMDDYIKGHTWLREVPELFDQRAPGGTCLSALRKRRESDMAGDYLAEPINKSKGCGGVMRTAPAAFLYHRTGLSMKQLDLLAAQCAAVTHGHSLGYMPSMIVNHILCRALMDSDKMTLKEMILEAKEEAKTLFAGDKHLKELCSLIDEAIALSENTSSDLENIHILGEGWVGEEAMAIALYCALKYEKDFSKAMITSVNHKGDSDSTGAVTGNILGTIVGYEAIPKKWKENLELSDVILELSDDLFTGPVPGDAAWEKKYYHKS